MTKRLKLSVLGVLFAGALIALGASALSSASGAEVSAGSQSAAAVHAATANPATNTACNNSAIFPGGIPSACLSVIMEPDKIHCLSSKGSRSAKVTAQLCNANDPNQLWMAIPQGLGTAYYQFWNPGSSCPAGASYYACGEPSGLSNIKADQAKYGYGYCMKSHALKPTSEFDVVMGPCFSLNNTHGTAAFKRQASDFLPGPTGKNKPSYLFYEGVAVEGHAYTLTTSRATQKVGSPIGIVRASAGNAAHELFTGAVLNASGAGDGDPPPGTDPG